MSSNANETAAPETSNDTTNDTSLLSDPHVATRPVWPMASCALALVRALKWQVFPVRQIFDVAGSPRCDCNNTLCKDIGKHPRVRWSKEATNDEQRVAELWDSARGYPNDSIGIATGAKSNIWVLDVDPRSGGPETLAALERQHGKLPKTVTVRTGSGGLHIYFKYPGPDYRNTAGALGKGLDTRGDGGYVVAPGSLHKSGQRYVWVFGPGDTALADAPPWLLTLAKTAGFKAPGTSRRPRSKERPGLHIAPPPRSEAALLLERILQHPLVSRMTEYPDEVDREIWRGVAQNMACAVADHDDLIEDAAKAFHDLSEGYTGYTWAETEQVFRESMISGQEIGPMSFDHMVQSGMPAELATPGATNLIHAGRLSLRVRTGGAAVEAVEAEAEMLIDAFKLGAVFDADAAYADALRRPETLGALARLMQRNLAAFELLKHELKKIGMKPGQVNSLERAVKPLSGKDGGAAQPASVATGVAPTMTLVPHSGALPEIEVADRQLREIDADARAALIKANSPPTVFRRGGALARISHESASPEIRNYTPETFALRLSEVADWIHETTVFPDAGPPTIVRTEKFPVREVVRSVLGQPPGELPEVEAICRTPYLGVDGQLVTDPGYSEPNRLFLVPERRVTGACRASASDG